MRGGETFGVERQLPNLNERIAQGVAYYWRARQQQSEKQIGQGRSDQGARSAVTGGYQMMGFSELITALLVDVGVAHKTFSPASPWNFLVSFDQPKNGTF